MNNISEVTESLTVLFKDIKNDTIDLKKASELNNTAGKLMKAYQIQLAYHALRSEAPNIPFLAAKDGVMTPRLSTSRPEVKA